MRLLQRYREKVEMRKFKDKRGRPNEKRKKGRNKKAVKYHLSTIRTGLMIKFSEYRKAVNMSNMEIVFAKE